MREYKEIRPLVQEGALYRLLSPRSGPLAALEYVSPDRSEAAIFAFRHTEHYWQAATRLRLRGLDPARRYRVSGLKVGQEIIVSGQSLLSGNFAGVFGSFRQRPGEIESRLGVPGSYCELKNQASLEKERSGFYFSRPLIFPWFKT